MALFKILKGNEASLPVEKHEGYMYITQDTGNIYVDVSSEERKQLNAKTAKYLESLNTNELYTVDTLLALINGNQDADSDKIELYDTVSEIEALEVKNIALSGYDLDIILSDNTNTITDFSGVFVDFKVNDEIRTVEAESDGSVLGLVAKPSFILTLHSNNYDVSNISITCTYRLDLNQIIHDYILHVDLDDDVEGSLSVIVDDSLSIKGAAADAKAVGDAVNALESAIDLKVDKVEGMGLSSNDFTDEYKDKLDNIADGGGSSIEVDADLLTSGKAADAKVTGDKIRALEDLVGTDSVSDQIAEALEGIEIEIDANLEKSGTAADAKVTGDEISRLDGKIGEASVADQIAEAIVEVYVQDAAPTDAPEGSIWVDTAKDGLSNANRPTNIYVVDIGQKDISEVDFSQYIKDDVIIVTQT